MNLFGIGGTELLLIVLIMLVVAGPKRMLQWAYVAGKYMGQLRIMWGQAMDSIQKELDDSGVDLKLPKDIPTRGDIARLASQALKPIQEPMQEVMDEYENERKNVNKTLDEEKQKIKHGTNFQRFTKQSVMGASNGHKVSQEDTEPDNTSRPADDFGTWSGTANKEE